MNNRLAFILILGLIGMGSQINAVGGEVKALDSFDVMQYRAGGYAFCAMEKCPPRSIKHINAPQELVTINNPVDVVKEEKEEIILTETNKIMDVISVKTEEEVPKKRKRVKIKNKAEYACKPVDEK